VGLCNWMVQFWDCGIGGVDTALLSHTVDDPVYD
jgi:hypothetical protein